MSNVQTLIASVLLHVSAPITSSFTYLLYRVLTYPVEVNTVRPSLWI